MSSLTPKKKQNGAKIILFLIVLPLGILLLFQFPRTFQWLSQQSWTGFGTYTITETTTITNATTGTPSEVSVIQKPQREKTLWDWIQILIVPLVLAISGSLLGAFIQRNQHKRSEILSQIEREKVEEQLKIQRINSEQQLKATRHQIDEQLRLSQQQVDNQLKESIFQDYLKQVTNLMSKNSNIGELEVSINIIQALTVSIITQFSDDPIMVARIETFLRTLRPFLPSRSGAIPIGTRIVSEEIEHLLRKAL